MPARLWVLFPLVGEGQDEGEPEIQSSWPLDTFTLAFSRRGRGKDRGRNITHRPNLCRTVLCSTPSKVWHLLALKSVACELEGTAVFRHRAYHILRCAVGNLGFDL